MNDTVQRYRHKDTGAEVEAVQLTKENVTEVADWCTGKEVVEHDALDSNITYVGLNFLSEGNIQRLAEGDWLIKNEQGDFHFLWPNSFEEYYEKVGE